MGRLFAFFAAMLLGGFFAPFHAPVAAATIQDVPQYYAPGREPWAPPFERRHRPTSAATVSMYIATLLYDSYSGLYCWIVIATPQTHQSRIIDLSNTFDNPYINVLAAGAKTLVALNPYDFGGLFLEFNLGNGNIFANVPVQGASNWIATDSQGTTYVSTSAGASGPLGVRVFAYGATTPSYTITNGVPNPNLLAVDAHDNLYVSNGNNIVVFPPGATTPVRTIAQGINAPGLMAFDKANHLIVYNGGSNAITVYKPKHQAPMSTITDGINGPSAIAIGPTGTLYVANYNASDITEYDGEHSTLSRTITTDTSGPRSIAVDDQDNLYEFVLGGKNGRAWLMYTFPHQSLQPSGKPWIFLQPRGTLPARYIIPTTGPAW